MQKRGLLYVIEGPDWTGKDYHLDRLAGDLSNDGYNVLKTREPGSAHDEICGKIRQLLLDSKNTGMANMAELFLYLADRAQHHEKLIMPALERGDIVLTSRSRYSTDAYQGIARGLGLDLTTKLNRIATFDIDPDFSVFIDADPEIVFAKRGEADLDRLERLGIPFQKKVREAYQQIAANDKWRIRVVDYIHGNPEKMYDQISSIFRHHMEKNGKNLNRKLRA